MNQCSAARSTAAATHWNGTCRSSIRSTGRCVVEQLAQRAAPVQVRAAAHRRAERARRPSRRRRRRSRTARARARASRIGRLDGRVGGEEGAVERADRRADDEVGHDAGLEQRPQHADLAGAEHPAAAEDEGGRRPAAGDARHALTLPPAVFRPAPAVPTTQAGPVPVVRERARREPVRRPAPVLRRARRWRPRSSRRLHRVRPRPPAAPAAAPRRRPPARDRRAGAGSSTARSTRVGAELAAGVTALRAGAGPAGRASPRTAFAARDRRRGAAAPPRPPRGPSLRRAGPRRVQGRRAAAGRRRCCPATRAPCRTSPTSSGRSTALGVAAQRAAPRRAEQQAARRRRRCSSGPTPTGGRRWPCRQAVDAQLAALLAEADRLTARLAVTADALVRGRARRGGGARPGRSRRRRPASAPRPARPPRAPRRAPRAAAAAPAVAGRDVLAVVPPAADGTCGPPSALGEANGFLPASTLCPLSTGARPPAAHRRRAGLRARCRRRTPASLGTAAVRHRLLPQLRRAGRRLRPQAQPGRGARAPASTAGASRSTCAAASRSSAARRTSGCARNAPLVRLAPPALGAAAAAASPSRGTGSTSAGLSRPVGSVAAVTVFARYAAVLRGQGTAVPLIASIVGRLSLGTTVAGAAAARARHERLVRRRPGWSAGRTRCRSACSDRPWPGSPTAPARCRALRLTGGAAPGAARRSSCCGRARPAAAGAARCRPCWPARRCRRSGPVMRALWADAAARAGAARRRTRSSRSSSSCASCSGRCSWRR